MKSLHIYLMLVLLCGVLIVAGCDDNQDSPASGVAVKTPPAAERPEQPDRTRADNGPATAAAAAASGVTDSGGAPRIESVKIEPVPAFPGTLLAAVVEATDPDDDLITYSYRWLRNDEPVDGEFEEFDTTGFSKGDLIAVEVTPSDGTADGETKKSLPVLLHNRPPEITSFPTGLVDGRFVYQVEASDPDGDALTFSLAGAPEGMTIDAESGSIDWQVPTDLSGAFQIRVLVDDGDAKAYQTFSLTFSPQQ